MQKKEIIARFHDKKSADNFAETANRRAFESVSVERKNEL